MVCGGNSNTIAPGEQDETCGHNYDAEHSW